MLFPIGDDQVKGGHRPVVSYSLIAINVLVFFWQSTDPAGIMYVLDGGAIPNKISEGEKLYTLFTSMFMHGGFMHLLGNMIFLWVFADNIEATIGSLKFSIYYLLGGLAASFAHIALDPSSPIPCVGASGAISAVMGSYLVAFPRSRIVMLFLPLLSRFRLLALYFLGFWIAQQLLSGMGSLDLGGGNKDGGGVAYWAHIGGFAFGVVAGFFIAPVARKYNYREFPDKD